MMVNPLILNLHEPARFNRTSLRGTPQFFERKSDFFFEIIVETKNLAAEVAPEDVFGHLQLDSPWQQLPF